jgi:hypothetical protein
MLVVFKTQKIRRETIEKVFGKVDTFCTYQGLAHIIDLNE